MDGKKKVLLVNDFEKGGGAEGVFQMTAALLRSTYEVFLYTAYKSFEDSGSNPFSYIYSRRHFRNIRDLVLQKDIDIVHIHNFRWISPSVLHVHKWLQKHFSKKVKFVLTAHDYLLACPNVAYGYYDKQNDFVRYSVDTLPGSFLFKQMDQHGLKFSILKKLQWYLAFKILNLQKQIDIVISPSVFLKKILNLNYSDLPIKVVRNPLPQEMQYQNNDLKYRRKNISNKIRLIYFGRVASEKGTDILIEMLSKIRGSLEFSLDIYGTGPISDQINPLINRLGLENYINFLGFKPFDELRRSFVNYDAFIMSSIWYENAPLSIVEAAINGLSIITPNIGGMKELAELCGNASFYELGDAKSLLHALTKVLGHTCNFSVDDLVKIVELFSPETYIKSLSDCYN